ncbi:MAG: hypothetical protein NTY48_06605 [Candidatus Diapherotrites archaeon]|nr:hypothetical protein [Candidatus Diapherotrites archaeon]
MNKGFIFTIEAAAAIVIVIFAMGVFSYSEASHTENNTTTQLMAQASIQQTLYFNLPATPLDASAKEQYCDKTIKFNQVNNSILSENNCGWKR